MMPFWHIGLSTIIFGRQVASEVYMSLRKQSESYLQPSWKNYMNISVILPIFKPFCKFCKYFIQHFMYRCRNNFSWKVSEYRCRNNLKRMRQFWVNNWVNIWSTFTIVFVLDFYVYCIVYYKIHDQFVFIVFKFMKISQKRCNITMYFCVSLIPS